jgi:ribonuclease HII
MAWVVGIDEAGYGPNLGPFVMSLVGCQAPDALARADLWQALGPAVRRGGEKVKKGDPRLLVADSKVVYSSAKGLAGLERGVLAALGRHLGEGVASLAGLVGCLCPEDHEHLRADPWYAGASPLPGHVEAEDLSGHARRFESACSGAGLGGWLVRSVVICPRQFNSLLDRHDSKGAVLTHGLTNLLRAGRELAREGALAFFVDKHGGRNTYAAMVQHALPGGAVLAVEEGAQRSHYRVVGQGREVELTFQPRADADHFCVALASMVSKYVRELLMGEFNAFWQARVPGLRPTAGYPGDAGRFFEEIRPAALALQVPEAALWRRK